jgi:serine/threonine-protein kinase
MDDLQQRLQAALPSRYTLERVLGRGGMATVFLARESHPQRQVAIKVLASEVAARVGRERFLREVDFASTLTHPHIVPVYAAGEAGGLLYYVMPYVEGESLRDRLTREPSGLPVDEALAIAHDVADALQVAHEHNIVHRDIKPENIFLHRGHALVADFGIARAMEAAGRSDTSRTDVTEVGTTLGTPAYMSPEQASAETSIDGRSDVYSLGCVLYEMLVGEPPFRGQSMGAVLARHLVDPVPSIRASRPVVPASVEEVVRRTLEKDPAKRFASARELSAALSGAADTPSPTRALVAVSRALVNSRRRRTLLGTGILAVVLLVLLMRSARSPDTARAASPYADSVAVMPCDNLTGDTSYLHLALGITDEVITHLSQVRELKVSGRHSVTVAKAGSLPIPELSRSLGVGYVLQCAIHVFGEQLRVTAQLLDRSGAGMMAQSYEADLATGFEAHDRLAGAITDDVTSQLGVTNDVVLLSHREHREGHANFLAGTAALARRTPTGLRRAIEQLELAIEIDPDYAAAYAALSQAYALAITYRYDVGLGGYDMAGRALSLAQRAIVLDSMLAEGYAARGYLRAIALAPPGDAAQDFERARGLQPNAPNVPSWMSRVYADRGQRERAFGAAQRAVDLDPRHAGRRIGVAYLALHLRRYDLAIAEARMARQLEPELMLPAAIEARALLLDGDPASCLQVPLGPHQVVRAMCLAAMGREAEAARIVDSVTAALSRPESQPLGDYTEVLVAEDLACYFAYAGDAQAALNWLSRAYSDSPTGVEVRVFESELFDAVRDDELFQRVARQIRAGIWSQVVEASRSGDVVSVADPFLNVS